MPTRRSLLTTASAGLALSALPANAQRANPMPEEIRRVLERDDTSPVLGNPDGNVTLSEFFDYNCPHCRTMMPRIQALIGEDPNLRVVFREWPIFGPGSDFAARASLASLSMGRYWQMHSRLLSTRQRIERPVVLRVAREIGLDETALRAEMDSDRIERHISMTYLLGDHMGLAGTPTFVCGDEAAFGALSMDDLRGLVARGRQTLGV
ncbi:DsbA family protein [Paracoccus sp. (in: a-proteobacteria)]|uniref:DsbA family protein n=1 Tax=Paracoccus sp. TaxID=267 RepID=UPI00272BFD52|nr:DsbA family protein [Paracoccus sp. (in: a-proteobacteria)]